jgi:hypothetical protein
MTPPSGSGVSAVHPIPARCGVPVRAGAGGTLVELRIVLAARIADQARGGEILASSVVKQLTESAGDLRCRMLIPEPARCRFQREGSSALTPGDTALAVSHRDDISFQNELTRMLPGRRSQPPSSGS